MRLFRTGSQPLKKYLGPQKRTEATKQPAMVKRPTSRRFNLKAIGSNLPTYPIDSPLLSATPFLKVMCIDASFLK